jgi:hypothetical protein
MSLLLRRRLLYRTKKGVRKALLEWGKVLPFPLKHSSEDFVCPLLSSFTSSLSRLSRLSLGETRFGADYQPTLLIPVIIIAFERFKERKQHHQQQQQQQQQCPPPIRSNSY